MKTYTVTIETIDNGLSHVTQIEDISESEITDISFHFMQSLHNKTPVQIKCEDGEIIIAADIVAKSIIKMIENDRELTDF
jgi:hypothetical protein